jgi:DoxX-like protein
MEDKVMEAVTQTPTVSKKMLWAGWIVSALPVLALLMSGVMKLAKPKLVVDGSANLGWDESLLLGLGITELTCALIYAFPRTAVLGAVLMTGYLGGAVATHVRIGEPFFGPVILGVLVWGGLWLRDVRVRALLPWRG